MLSFFNQKKIFFDFFNLSKYLHLVSKQTDPNINSILFKLSQIWVQALSIKWVKDAMKYNFYLTGTNSKKTNI